MKGYAEGDEGGRRGRRAIWNWMRGTKKLKKGGGGRRALFRRLAGILNAQLSKLCSEVGCDFCGYTYLQKLNHKYLFHLVLFS